MFPLRAFTHSVPVGFPVSGTPPWLLRPPDTPPFCALKAPLALVPGAGVTGCSRALCMKSLIQCLPLYRIESHQERARAGLGVSPLLATPNPTSTHSSCPASRPPIPAKVSSPPSLPTWFGESCPQSPLWPLWYPLPSSKTRGKQPYSGATPKRQLYSQGSLSALGPVSSGASHQDGGAHGGRALGSGLKSGLCSYHLGDLSFSRFSNIHASESPGGLVKTSLGLLPSGMGT